MGNFDGVHLGHALMLSTGQHEARWRGIPFTIMTFDPHPMTILKPETDRRPLTTAAQRQEIMGSYDPDVLIVIPTSPEFLSMTAEVFLRDVVQGTASRGLGATLMVEGPTFSFGRGARGDVRMLQAVGPLHGFETIVVPTQQQSLTDLTMVNVSSSVIRWLIQQGRVADARKCLGRPHTLTGTVVDGEKRGKAIGFPTANMRTIQLVPAPGVYAGCAQVDGQTHVAAISVGDNPTFQGKAITLEAFLLDFEGNLYGKPISLAFHNWVREMLVFSGVGPLVRQMELDVRLTRKMVRL